MTWSEYAGLAQRTSSTKTPEDKVGHGILGLIGEAGEIIDIIKKQKYMGMPEETAHEKLLDEAGDFAWYIVELCTGLGYNVDEVMSDAQEYDCLNESLEEAAVNMVGMIADVHYENSDDMASIVFEDAVDVACQFMSVLDFANIDIEAMKEHNIAKLRKRYPEGFSAERSNARYQ